MAAKRPEEVVQYVLKNMGEHATVAERVVNDLRNAGWIREASSVEAYEKFLNVCEQRESAISQASALRVEVSDLTRERNEFRERWSTVTRERDEAQKMRDYHEGRQRVAESSVATLSNALAFVRKERDEARRKEADTSDAMVYVMQAIESATGEKPVAMFVPELLERWRRNLVATQSSPEVLAVVENAKKLRAYMRKYEEIGSFYGGEHLALAMSVDALAAVERKAEPKPEPRKFWTTEVWPNGSIQQFGVQRGSEWHGPFAPEVCHALAIALNAADAAGRKS